jgi:hypothetical protein
MIVGKQDWWLKYTGYSGKWWSDRVAATIAIVGIVVFVGWQLQGEIAKEQIRNKAIQGRLDREAKEYREQLAKQIDRQIDNKLMQVFGPLPTKR